MSDDKHIYNDTNQAGVEMLVVDADDLPKIKKQSAIGFYEWTERHVMTAAFDGQMFYGAHINGKIVEVESIPELYDIYLKETGQ